MQFSYFCLYEAKTVCQPPIMSALQGRFGEFLALEVVQVDGIFEASDQVPSVCSISPITSKSKQNIWERMQNFWCLTGLIFPRHPIVTQICNKIIGYSRIKKNNDL